LDRINRINRILWDLEDLEYKPYLVSAVQTMVAIGALKFRRELHD